MLISWVLMNGEVPHGIKWLPGALSPLCFPVLAAARSFFGSLLTFSLRFCMKLGITQDARNLLSHPVGGCCRFQDTFQG